MKLYGIDFNKYVCGGIGNCKLRFMGKGTVLFYSETEMLNEVAELKKDNCIGEIKPFITHIVNKEKYEF